MKQQQSVRYIKAVATSPVLNSQHQQAASRRRIRLAVLYFTAFLVLVLFAFTHTYFVHFPRFEKVTTAGHVHGLLMFAWFILLIVQPFLILTNRYLLHQQLGKVTYLLVPLLLLSIIWVAAAAQQRTPNAISLFDSVPPFIGFSLFYLMAISNRQHAAVHARYMMITPLVLYGPAIARVYEHYPVLNSFPMYAITFVLLLGILIYEWRHQRIFRPWFYALAFHILTLVAYVFFLPSPAWQQMANWFISMAA